MGTPRDFVNGRKLLQHCVTRMKYLSGKIDQRAPKDAAGKRVVEPIAKGRTRKNIKSKRIKKQARLTWLADELHEEVFEVNQQAF